MSVNFLVLKLLLQKFHLNLSVVFASASMTFWLLDHLLPAIPPKIASTIHFRLRSKYQCLLIYKLSSNVQKYKEFGQFKLFEGQQTAQPCNLRVNKNRRAAGPCGIPSIDCSNGYARFNSDRHPELSKPLDLEALNEDFDFDANLALFNKESLSDGEKDSSEPELRVTASNTSRNFRHDENVLNDPSRVISWLSNNQQQDATKFKPLRLEKTSDGLSMPVLSFDDKQRYLKVHVDLNVYLLGSRKVLGYRRSICYYFRPTFALYIKHHG